MTLSLLTVIEINGKKNKNPSFQASHVEILQIQESQRNETILWGLLQIIFDHPKLKLRIKMSSSWTSTDKVAMRLLDLHRPLYMVMIRQSQNFRMRSQRAFQTFHSIIPKEILRKGKKRSIEYEHKWQLYFQKEKNHELILTYVWGYCFHEYMHI